MRVSWQLPHPLCKGKLNPAWKGGQVLCQPHKQGCTSSQLQRGNCLNRLPWSEWYVHARGSWLTPRFLCRLNKGAEDNRRTLVALSGFWGRSAACDMGSGGGIKRDNLLTTLPGAPSELQWEWFSSGCTYLKKNVLKTELVNLSHPTFYMQS